MTHWSAATPSEQSWGAKVRLIAGSAGGRRLAVAPGGVTRPTTDRVREALFSAITSWLGTSDRPAEATLAGIAFCDLYAGSGGDGTRGGQPRRQPGAARGGRPAHRSARRPQCPRVGAARHGPNGARRGPTPTVTTAAVRHPVCRSAVRPGEFTPQRPADGHPARRLDQTARARHHRAISPVAEAVLASAFGRTWARTYGETVVEFGAVDSLRATEGEL